MLKIDILTLFPEMFTDVLNASMLKRAQAKRKVAIRVHDIRDFARDRHKTCDDRPFGGGAGMIMKCEPIDACAKKILAGKGKKGSVFIYMTPQGKTFSQKDAVRLAGKKQLVILSGHYEGVDERILKLWADEEISIGDYILTGGELPAMVLVDAVTRLLPGVLGNAESKSFETFSRHLLEYPQYTRPRVFRGLSVPRVLLGGNHQAIEDWRAKQSLFRTKERRADLLKALQRKTKR